MIQSELKFAAYGFVFVKNSLSNYSKYFQRMNEALLPNNIGIDKNKAEKFQSFLRQINIKHITILFGLPDVYHVIAKCQHGVCKVNQLPWIFHDKIDELKSNLELIKARSYNGFFKRQEDNLKKRLLPDGFPIVTEMKKTIRNVYTRLAT